MTVARQQIICLVLQYVERMHVADGTKIGVIRELSVLYLLAMFYANLKEFDKR